MTYDYPTAFSAWDGDENRAFARVINSEQYTMAGETEAFEHEFAAYHGMKHCIAVNSGSSANLVAVAALFHLERNPLKPGDKAIVPAIAWATTYAPLVQMGLDLVLIDADKSWNPDVEFWHEHIFDVRLIVGCSILGIPADLDRWSVRGSHIGYRFIEDNCESLGASIGGKKCGTFGLMNTFSFFHSHQLSAIEGGAILTDDDECARLCRLLRNHGNAGFVDKQTDFDKSYDFVLFGYNVRPLELHMAIAREQLKKLDRFILARNENLAYFWTMADQLQRTGELIRPRVNGSMSPFGLHFTVESRDVRTKLVGALRAAGVDCRLPTGGSFGRHPYAKKWRDQATPRADEIHERGLFLGNAPFPIEDKIDRAIRTMKEVL
jgi:CDP-4-dehydro-6-deoxyglucose reductase, E1